VRYLGRWIFLLLLMLCPLHARAEAFSFRSSVTPTDLTATLKGELSLPKKAGPFPAVILMHPCGGLEPIGLAALQAHAKELVDSGFATLIFDSYGPRNLTGGKACGGGMRTASFRRADAFNAMEALQRHEKISKDNIFLVGFSDGALAGLVSAKGGSIGNFRAVGAYYPWCGPLEGTSYAIRSPTLVFVAEKDDWTPPAGCIKAKNAGVVTGAEFEVITYPGAHHSFDQQRPTIKYMGHTLAYSREATLDSRKRLKEFFIKYLTDELKTTPPFSAKAK
jgi:dienelactone hydrolase